MERTRVADMADRHCGKLSKGYRQRVGLAQAILHNPEVLILDEPTAGLDPKQILETRELIRGLAGDHTVILSTHILPEVAQTCQRVVIINKGRVVAVDTPDNLTARLRGSETMYVQVDSAGADATDTLRTVPGVTTRGGGRHARRHPRLRGRERAGPRRAPRAGPRGGRRWLGPAGTAPAPHEPRADLPAAHHRGGVARRCPVRNILAIAGRELRSYFASPIAYVVVGLFALLFGYFFYAILVFFSEQSMRMGMMGGPGSHEHQPDDAAAAPAEHERDPAVRAPDDHDADVL